MSHDLSSLDHLPIEKRNALKALGYTSYEQFAYAAQVAAPELASYLEVESIDSLISQISVAATAISADVLETISSANYALGVAIDDIPRLTAAPGLSVAPPNNTGMNLIGKLPAVRHQQGRGTCVAHAALGIYEHHLMTKGSYHDLSEQFLYWNCKQSDGIPQTTGTYLGIALPLLKRDGCCPEASWPYEPLPVAGNEGQGPPPGGAQLIALSFRLPAFKVLSPTSVDDLKGELARGCCVAFSIPVFNSWYRNTWVAATGDIVMPIPGEVRAGGHAMCLVGYEDMPGSPEFGGGRFILRNSWGKDWGINSPYGPGYGTMPYAYLARFGAEAYSIS